MEDGDIVDTEADLFRNDWGKEDTFEQEARRREVQANQFAAALLMPARMVEEIYQEVTKDIAEIARIFKVSKEAMGYRLDQLGLL
jgi:Zn-dependent peptidase ImmA (M78 family)